MWFAKPYYLKVQHNKHRYHSVAEDENVAYDEEQNGHAGGGSADADDDEEEEEVWRVRWCIIDWMLISRSFFCSLNFLK